MKEMDNYREYIVTFLKKGLPFHERNRVYAENRNQAAKVVRNHYGKGVITIISIRLACNEYKFY